MTRKTTLNAEIVWEEPAPVETQANAALLENLEKIKERPGEWARIAQWEGESGAYAARQRLVKKELHAEFDFEVRKVPPKGSALYAKFKGKRNSVPIPRP